MGTNVTYRSWSNRETWLANMLIPGDMGSGDIIAATKRRYSSNRHRAKLLERLMWEEMRDKIEEPCLWADLLTIAFDRINWLEIIERNL